MKIVTRQQLIELENEAKKLTSSKRKATVRITADYDSEIDKYVITELFALTSGMCLYTQEETYEYIKQVQECQDFINKYKG